MVSPTLQPGLLILDDVAGPAPEPFRTRGVRLAFWINAYNALVARGIAALGLRRSVWEIPDLFDRLACRIGALVFSANEIEHGVLRGNRPNPVSGAVPFAAGDPRRAYAVVPVDPRIHFAISCGARSCPAVRAYHPERLDEELDAATRAFVNREVTLDGETLAASPIFQWFRVDFEDTPGRLAGFLARYLDEGPVRRAVLLRGVAALAWRPYDWRLQPGPPPGGGGGAL